MLKYFSFAIKFISIFEHAIYLQMNTLYRNSVLVLNKHWQAINVTTPATALSMMFSETATGLEIQQGDCIIPHKWNSWIGLSVLDTDEFVNTPRGKIKVPKVIVLMNYSQVPMKRLRFSMKNLWSRDKGRCQYTGKILTESNGNVDHVVPKSKGGKTTWTNCVLCHKEVNSKKGDKTPAEAGLRLLSVPKEPAHLPSSVCIKNPLNIEEWKAFLY